MKAFIISRGGAPVSVLFGLCLALFMAAGCGGKPPPPAKPKTEAPKAGTPSPPLANVSEQFVSVFETLPPKIGKDPFFPASHRRDPVTPVEPAGGESGSPSAPVEAVLVLRAVIGSGRHSQVVINNQVFEIGEQQSVRVPNGHVRVRCLEIAGNSALVQVEGEPGPKRLVIEQKKY